MIQRSPRFRLVRARRWTAWIEIVPMLVSGSTSSVKRREANDGRSRLVAQAAISLISRFLVRGRPPAPPSIFSLSPTRHARPDLDDTLLHRACSHSRLSPELPRARASARELDWRQYRRLA